MPTDNRLLPHQGLWLSCTVIFWTIICFIDRTKQASLVWTINFHFEHEFNDVGDSFYFLVIQNCHHVTVNVRWSFSLSPTVQWSVPFTKICFQKSPPFWKKSTKNPPRYGMSPNNVSSVYKIPIGHAFVETFDVFQQFQTNQLFFSWYWIFFKTIILKSIP